MEPYNKLHGGQSETEIVATKIEEEYKYFTVTKGCNLKNKIAGFELHTLNGLDDENNDHSYGIKFGHKDKIFQLTTFNNPYGSYLKKQLKEKKYISKGTLQIVCFFDKHDKEVSVFLANLKENGAENRDAKFFKRYLNIEGGLKMYATVEDMRPKRSTFAWLWMRFLVFCRMRKREKSFKIQSCTGRKFKRCSDKFSGWRRECSGEEAVAGIIAKYGHIYDFSNLKEEKM